MFCAFVFHAVISAICGWSVLILDYEHDEGWSDTRTLLCCVNLSSKLTSPGVVSDTHLLLSGTRFLEQYSKAHQ